MNGCKKWMDDYHGYDCFVVVADCSKYCYVSTITMKNVFRQQGYSPE